MGVGYTFYPLSLVFFPGKNGITGQIKTIKKKKKHYPKLFSGVSGSYYLSSLSADLNRTGKRFKNSSSAMLANYKASSVKFRFALTN